jgi:hypothetical protein
VKRIAIDHIYHKTFKLLGMKYLTQCDGQHGNGPMRKNQQIVSPWHSFRLHQLNILHQWTTLMVGPTSLCRGLVQYTTVGTEWKASSGTIPTDHMNSTSGNINVHNTQNQQIYIIWLKSTADPTILLIQINLFSTDHISAKVEIN